MECLPTYIVNCLVRRIDLRRMRSALHASLFDTFPADVIARGLRLPRYRYGLFGKRRALYLILAVALLASSMCAGAESSNTRGVSAAWNLARSNPGELVRRAVRNELAGSRDARVPVRFRVRKITGTSDTTKEVVDTVDGGVARLIAIHGQPLPPAAEKKEIHRLHALEADPSIQAHRHQSERRDEERIIKFTRLLPDAFLYRFAGHAETKDGPMVRLQFSPNPKFSPPDFASRVMTGLHGEMWVDPNDLRITRIQSRFFRKVDFGWGILGVLYPGGTMQLEQSKTPECGWQLTRLSLHMTGRELLFKSLDISIEETIGNYKPVPSSWTYRDAVRWLLEMQPGS